MTATFEDYSAKMELTTNTAQTIASASILLATNPDAPLALTRTLRERFGPVFGDAVRAMVRADPIWEPGQR